MYQWHIGIGSGSRAPSQSDQVAERVVLAIVGSTTLFGNAEAQAAVEHAFDKYQPDEFTSGGAPGIDTMGANEANKRGIPKKIFRPTRNRWEGEGGFKARNIQIAEHCTHIVRIYASNSRTYGSGWCRDLALALGKVSDADDNIKIEVG